MSICLFFIHFPNVLSDLNVKENNKLRAYHMPIILYFLSKFEPEYAYKRNM